MSTSLRYRQAYQHHSHTSWCDTFFSTRRETRRDSPPALNTRSLQSFDGFSGIDGTPAGRRLPMTTLRLCPSIPTYVTENLRAPSSASCHQEARACCCSQASGACSRRPASTQRPPSSETNAGSVTTLEGACPVVAVYSALAGHGLGAWRQQPDGA